MISLSERSAGARAARQVFLKEVVIAFRRTQLDLNKIALERPFRCLKPGKVSLGALRSFLASLGVRKHE